MKKYVVVFIDVDEETPLHERSFHSKEEALAYKHEHPKGKFASVVRSHGTFAE